MFQEHKEKDLHQVCEDCYNSCVVLVQRKAGDVACETSDSTQNKPFKTVNSTFDQYCIIVFLRLAGNEFTCNLQTEEPVRCTY